MPLMKRLSFLFILAICALAVAAQDVVRVNYRGSRPTIRDFAVAYLSTFPGADEVEEGEQEGLRLLDDMKAALARQSKGQPLDKSETLTIDQQNGFLLYQQRHDDYTTKIELCFWNESDGKHKLVACYREYSEGGRDESDGLIFFRYNNATKEMTRCMNEDLGIYGKYIDGYDLISYSLPRKGKDIIVTSWKTSSDKKQTRLKWNGRRFTR